MLGDFPQLYPGELLYSGWARFEAWMGYSHPNAVRHELFGNPRAGFVVDLPNRLDAFVEKLPPGHSYTADQLIDEHTHYPFYAAFLPDERRCTVRTGMHTSQSRRAVYREVGVTSGRWQPAYFRFCPCCVVIDRQQYGETYWHRLHQVPGMWVCPIHQVWLEHSLAYWRHNPTHHVFTPAEQAVQARSPRSLKLLQFPDRVYFQLAQDIQWLFEHVPLHWSLNDIQQQYWIRLAQQNWASYNGNILITALTDAIWEFYTAELLDTLCCALDEHVSVPWTARILRKHRHKMAMFPLYHLLLIQFLGCTAETFFTELVELKPFGEGPYPCLNPVAEHYQENCITDCEIEYRSYPSSKPKGTFRCECGFSYSRLGPDQCHEDHLRAGTILSRGHVWDAYLVQLWDDPQMKVSDLQSRLHMHWKDIQKHALRLQLAFPPPGRRVTSITRDPESIPKTIPALDPKPYRERWLAMLKKYPDEGVSKLRQRASGVHTWLWRHDREWLLANQPAQLPKHKRCSRNLDWKQRDLELCAQLDKAFERLRARPGRPKRVSREALAVEIGRKADLQRQRERLPLATACLYDLAESNEDFAIRRVHWVAAEFRLLGQKPTLYQLKKEASIHIPEYNQNAKIQQALQEVLSSFEGGC